MDNNKYIFSGHESFSLREGWIVKGIRAILNNGKTIFIGKELMNTIDELGIGANMVKSLKYWLEIYDIIDENIELNPLVAEIKKYDEYMQYKITLWFIHYLSLTPLKKRRAIIWDIISYKNENMTFNKDHMIDLIDSETDKKYSKNTIETSLGVYIKTYISETEKNANDPENNLISPFAKLEYLRRDKKNEEYFFRSINYKEINSYFGYLVLKSFCEKFNVNKIEKIEAYNKFKLIVKMDSYNFEMLLKEMENNSLINIDRAAGLNNINLTAKLTDKEIIKKMYKDV